MTAVAIAVFAHATLDRQTDGRLSHKTRQNSLNFRLKWAINDTVANKFRNDCCKVDGGVGWDFIKRCTCLILFLSGLLQYMIHINSRGRFVLTRRRGILLPDVVVVDIIPAPCVLSWFQFDMVIWTPFDIGESSVTIEISNIELCF